MPDEQSSTDVIVELENRRYAAMVAGDVDTLDELLSDRLVYGHTRGNRDSKAVYLAKIADGRLAYDSIEHPVEQVLPAGDTAVVIGQMIATARSEGRPIRMHNTCMVVWTLEDGRWRVLGYQATPLVA